ncbi:putative transposase [Paenibacillus sp. DS2015]|uniref:hypothetical protein n=1 Tax=Paenibacillus sp. DS2015 TaxID=3373917 RepID=UPI003D1C7113
MKVGKLKINASISYLGIEHKIVGFNYPNVVLQRVTGDYDTFQIQFQRLVTDKSFVSAKWERTLQDQGYKSILETLPEFKREKVSSRYELIRPLILLEKSKQNDVRAAVDFIDRYQGIYIFKNEDVRRITQEEMISRIILNNRNTSRATLLRHLSAYRNGEEEGLQEVLQVLADKADQQDIVRKDEIQIAICSPNDETEVLCYIYTRKDKLYLPYIKDAIEKKYLTTQRIKISAVARYMKGKCEADQIEPLPEITVRGLINQLDKKVVAILRDGRRAIEMYKNIDRGFSNKEAHFPLHLVEIDHTKMDIILVDEVTRTPLGRPWITMGIDVYTRMVWCMHISFDEPSSRKVRNAFEHGLYFKRSIERYDSKNDWPLSGIPMCIMMDNGRDFRSKHVKRMITETMKSRVQYRPVRTPNYGATIERLFGNLNTMLIHTLPGTTKSSVGDLGDYEAEQNACLTLDELTKIVGRYITDFYHYHVNKGLPEESPTPIIRYKEGVEQFGYPEFVFPEDETYYRIELMPTEFKPYTREGVVIDKVHYKSDDLKYMIGKKEVKYKVKFDDDDITKIYIQPPNSTEFVECWSSNPHYSQLIGITRYTWKKINVKLREMGKIKLSETPGAEQIHALLLEIQKEAEEAYTKSKKVQKEVKKMNLQVEIKTKSSQFSNQDNHSIVVGSLEEMIQHAYMALEERGKNNGST